MIKNAMKQLIPAVGVGAGAIAKGYADKFIPLENPLVKNGITFIGGLVLAGMKNNLISAVGLGLAGASVQGVATQFLPGLSGPGEDPIMDFSADDMDDDIDGPGSDPLNDGYEEIPS